jgi:hypothetical protein
LVESANESANLNTEHMWRQDIASTVVFSVRQQEATSETGGMIESKSLEVSRGRRKGSNGTGIQNLRRVHHELEIP